MTNRELVEILYTMEPDTEVVIESRDYIKPVVAAVVSDDVVPVIVLLTQLEDQKDIPNESY